MFELSVNEERYMAEEAGVCVCVCVCACVFVCRRFSSDLICILKLEVNEVLSLKV